MTCTCGPRSPRTSDSPTNCAASTLVGPANKVAMDGPLPRGRRRQRVGRIASPHRAPRRPHAPSGVITTDRPVPRLPKPDRAFDHRPLASEDIMALSSKFHLPASSGRPTDATQQVFWVLRVGFTLLPIVFGLDKFANVLTDWSQYLAPWLDDLVP